MTQPNIRLNHSSWLDLDSAKFSKYLDWYLNLSFTLTVCNCYPNWLTYIQICTQYSDSNFTLCHTKLNLATTKVHIHL